MLASAGEINKRESLNTRNDLTQCLELLYLQNRLKHIFPSLRFVYVEVNNHKSLQAESRNGGRIRIAPLTYAKTTRIPLVQLPNWRNLPSEIARIQYNLEIVVMNIDNNYLNNSKSIESSKKSCWRRRLVFSDLHSVANSIIEMIETWEDVQLRNVQKSKFVA